MGKTFDFSKEKPTDLPKYAGLTFINCQTHKIPVGGWPRDMRENEPGHPCLPVIH